MPPKTTINLPTGYDAGRYNVANPYIYFAQEHRARVRETILNEDPELQRRIQEAYENYDSEDENCEDAENELYSRSEKILKEEFENIPESERTRYFERAVQARANTWRSLRSQGRLAENEESLKQKEEDEKNGITGPVPLTRFGANQGAAANQHQVTGTFVGGEILTPVQVLTPPFDRNGLKMKTGKIEPEEYF